MLTLCFLFFLPVNTVDADSGPKRHHVNQIRLPLGTAPSLSAKRLAPRTIKPFDHQAGSSYPGVTAKAFQQLGQLFTAVAYSSFTQTVTLAFIPSSACLPGGLRPRHRRFKLRMVVGGWGGGVWSRWTNVS